MIRVRQLVKEYRGAVTTPALRGVDLDVEAGTFAAVVGPSGCGKSTLLYVVGGMLGATSGAVHVRPPHTGTMNEKKNRSVPPASPGSAASQKSWFAPRWRRSWSRADVRELEPTGHEVGGVRLVEVQLQYGVFYLITRIIRLKDHGIVVVVIAVDFIELSLTIMSFSLKTLHSSK